VAEPITHKEPAIIADIMPLGAIMDCAVIALILGATGIMLNIALDHGIAEEYAPIMAHRSYMAETINHLSGRESSFSSFRNTPINSNIPTIIPTPKLNHDHILIRPHILSF
jgi:hypothetical protein